MYKIGTPLCTKIPPRSALPLFSKGGDLKVEGALMKAEYVFSTEDLRDLASRGIPPATALAQIATFRKGLPFIVLQQLCTVGDGMTHLSYADITRYGESYPRAAHQGRRW